jgi:hypothetical protein
MMWTILLIAYVVGVGVGIWIAVPIIFGEPTAHGQMILLPLAFVMVVFWPAVIVWALWLRLVELFGRKSP